MLSEVAPHQESRLRPRPIAIILGLAALRCHRMHNFYLGGSTYVAPNPPAVRLSRSTRPAARRQKHCTTMDLMAERLTLVHLRRIRIRGVHYATKECTGN